MQITLHAKERYCERILGIPKEEIKEYLAGHGAEVEKALFDMMNQAEWVWTKEDKDFHICDIYLMVTSGKTVISIVKNDYGFDDEMNRQIVQHQLKKLRELRIQQQKVNNKANHRLSEIKAGIVKVDMKIKSLESRVKKEQALRRELASQSEGIEAEVDVIQKDIDQECYKLVYSTAFKMDELRSKKKGA